MEGQQRKDRHFILNFSDWLMDNVTFRYPKISIVLFLVAFFSLAAMSSCADAGPLYDHYWDLKNAYPNFFQRLLNTQKADDTQIRNWLSTVDDNLAGKREVITQTNFKDNMTNALLNTLLMIENKAVSNAVFAAYSQKISTGNVSGDLAGFYDAVKTVVLSHVVLTDFPPNNQLTNYAGPLKVNLSGFMTSVQYYYTLDGSTPTTSSNLFTGTPIEISLAMEQKILKVIAAKKNTVTINGTVTDTISVSDTAVFIYDAARGTVQGVVRQEATALRRVRLYLELDGQEFDAAIDENGNYRLDNVPAGSRVIKGISDKYLSARVPIQLAPEQLAKAPELIMRAGDLNGDGKIDLADLGILSSAYGYKKSGGAPYSAADINEDGVVDLSDLGWLAANYGMTAN